MERAPLTPTDDGVHDPRLSDAANAALTWELHAVLESDAAHGGRTGEVWHPRANPTRQHWRLTTAVLDARILVVPVAVMLGIIALVVVIAAMGESYVVVGIAGVAVLVGVVAVAEMIARMTREVEHLSPETAALLEGEGIGDPDRLFGDLLAQRRDAAIPA